MTVIWEMSVREGGSAMNVHRSVRIVAMLMVLLAVAACKHSSGY